MTTFADIAYQALKGAGVIGVGQIASAEDINDCLFECNAMIGEWSRKRWLVYHLIDVSKVADGSTSYTVGTGGDFNVTRPDRIESAFVRLLNGGPNQPDYLLTIYEAREDYNKITLKSLNSMPYIAFYDSAFPLGNLYVWPIPSNQYEIHISVKETLTQFANTASQMNFPPEYLSALRWNLAARIRPNYQLPPDPTVTAMAKNALNTLRKANTQIARLQIPSELVRNSRVYNIYSDQ